MIRGHLSKLYSVALLCVTALPAAGQDRICAHQLNSKTSLTRIVGGEQVSIADYPWQVSLQMGGSHFCGGTVIHPQWVLTAAHCVLGEDHNGRYDIRSKYRSGDVAAMMGITDLRGAGPALAFSDVFVHPAWNSSSSGGNDIALVRLRTPVENRHVVGLATPGFDRKYLSDGVCTVVSGWGLIEEEGRGSSTLRAASVPLVSQAECSSAYPQSRLDTTLCAGYRQGGVDSCQGDSGGPLVVDSPIAGRVLVGVVSYGLGCARSEAPGVYTRVSSFTDWIKATIAAHP